MICEDPLVMQQIDRKLSFGQVEEKKHFFLGQSGSFAHQAPPTVSYPCFRNQNIEDAFPNEKWDDLRSVMQFAVNDPSYLYDCTETSLRPPLF